MPLVPTTDEHIQYLADNLKPDNQMELAWFGRNTKSEVKKSYKSCLGNALSGFHEDKLLFIFGVSHETFLFENASTIIYLCTKDFDLYPRAALRMTKQLMESVGWDYTPHKRIEQALPPVYDTGIRFLEYLGWKKGKVISVGTKQALHMYYDKE